MKSISKYHQYQFQVEDAGNGLSCTFNGPREEYDLEHVQKRKELAGHSAGKLVTVFVTNKDRNDIYYGRQYWLKRARTIPSVRNEWGDVTATREEMLLFPLTEDWIDMTDGLEEEPMPKDAARVPEPVENDQSGSMAGTSSAPRAKKAVA